MEKEIINIPLEIPKALIDAGAIQLYATKFAGWTPKIIEQYNEDVFDEVGNLVTQNTKARELDNPETALEACVREIRGYVRNNYALLMEEDGARRGREAARKQLEVLFK